jgi:hypothetical protein
MTREEGWYNGKGSAPTVRNAKSGDMLVFKPQQPASKRLVGEAVAAGLREGDYYQVRSLMGDGWRTEVLLVGHDEWFNGVLFSLPEVERTVP